MNDHDTPENVAETMRDVMQEFGTTEAIHDPSQHDDGSDFGGVHAFHEPYIVATPNGRQIHDLTAKHIAAAEYLKPARRKGTAQLQDLDSVILWTNRFKAENSVMFANADRNAPSLTVIADYHLQGPADATTPSGDATARHAHHRAMYDFPLSDEWKAWMAVSDLPAGMEKDDLGEFIEAQAKDIMDPTPGIIKMDANGKIEPWEKRLIETAQQIEGRYGQLTQLLAMSKQFQVYEQSDLSVKTNRDTGEAQIEFKAEHRDEKGKPLSIPNLIIITIPVFQGGAPYRIPVRFRYRKSGGNIKFILQVYNPDKVFRACFDEALAKATTETELPLMMGAPE